MYRMLIVDDEPLSRVGLKSMVDRADLDVEVVGTASNGLEALESIGRLRPDIVIADLRMPALDGLGLIERCRADAELCPAFIVVTGYADFDSLRRAMRDSAVDYLVKLELDEASLRASVEKAKAAVREKKRQGLASPSGAGADPFAETVLARLLSGSFADGREAISALERSGLSLGASGFRVALFEAEYAGEGRLSEEERLRAYCCAIDMVKQVVGREIPVMVVAFDAYSFAAFLGEGEPAASGAESSDASFIGILERVRDVVEKYFGLRLRAGLGRRRLEPVEAAESCREARLALAAASGGEAIVSFDDLRRRGGEEAARAGDKELLEGFRARVIAALSARSAESLRSALLEALDELERPDADLAFALALCCEFLYPVLERLGEAQELLDSAFPGPSGLWRVLFSAPSPRAASAWLSAFGEKVVSRLESAEMRSRNPLVSGVKRYVMENYSSRLTLVDLAERFEVSPNHLSTLFKKYAGLGFAEYVAQVKIEKAKELIAGGGYKMFQVAQLLGFEDAFYFSKVFKRVSGMSPREFYLSSCERGPAGEDRDSIGPGE